MSKNFATDGYATVYALITIGVLSIVGAAFTGPEYIMGRQLISLKNEIAKETELYDAVSVIVNALLSDPTPEADSPSDPVWDLVDKGWAGVSFTLEDVSTGLNLNTIPTDKLKEPSLTMAASGGSLAASLEKLRDNGPVRRTEQVLEYIPEEIYQTYFSLYGLLNPRICETDVLKSAISARLEGDAGAVVASDVLAMCRRPETRQTDLSAYLANMAPRLQPIVSLQPMINVNFAERELLKAVLEFRYWGRKLNNPGKVLGDLMFERLAGEVLPLDLERLLASEQNVNWVKDFLGTQTWFWRLRVTNEDNLGLEVYIARLPGKKASYQIIERRWVENE